MGPAQRMVGRWKCEASIAEEASRAFGARGMRAAFVVEAGNASQTKRLRCDSILACLWRNVKYQADC